MSPGPVRAGVSLPLSGRHAVQGEEARRGFELWREDVERAGGLSMAGRPRPLELRLLDDGSASRRALENLRALAADGAEILFGPYGRASGVAASSFARASGRVLWNHGASADEAAGPPVVTLPTPASRYLHGVVDLAAVRGCRSLVIAANEAPFGRAVAGGGAPRAAAAGMAVRLLPVVPGGWEAHHDEFIASAGGDAAVVLCGRLEDDVAAVAALRGAGAAPRVLAAVGAGVGRFGEALGPDARGVVGPSQWEPDDRPVDAGPSPEEVVDRYRDRHGGSPDYLAVQAWAAGVLAAAALAEAGPDPEATWRWALGFRGSTAYGGFALTPEGRQVGHQLRLIEWGSDGRRHLIG